MRPDDPPQFITYAISICICCIMCPIMSFAATLLFKENKTFGTWVQTWGMNFPMALLYQMFYCGPLIMEVDFCPVLCIPEVPVLQAFRGISHFVWYCKAVPDLS